MQPFSRLIKVFLDVAKIEGLSGNERAVGDYIGRFLRQLNLEVKEDDAHRLSGGNCGNLICKIGSGGDFVMLSHMDTARSTAHLNPIVKEDRICSDGTTILGADNRVGIAILLFAIEHALNERIPLRDFTVAFTICEETTLIGARHLTLDEKIGMGFVFDSALRPGYFINQSFGAQSFKIKITGKATHSGIAPEKGISSIEVAARAIADLRLGRLQEDTTANIGKIRGGTAINVIPEETLVEGEVRSLEVGHINTVIADIRAQFEKAAEIFDARMDFTAWWDFRPYQLTPEMPVYRRVEAALQKVGFQPTPKISAGGSDANPLNARGIPAVNIGTGAQNPHSNQEFILLEDLQKAAEIALQLMKA